MAIINELAIYNLALNAVGERSNLSSPSENSRPAEVCRLWYDAVREQVLSAAHWPEATKIDYLALLVERDEAEAWVNTDPRDGYAYVYQLPTDCLRPRYLQGFGKFLITHYGTDQRVLHTSTEQAALVYTANITNVALFEPTLRMAIVYALAGHICTPLSGNSSRSKLLVEKANELIWLARENAANASTERFESVPDWIAIRGGDYSIASQYFYPLGSTLTTSS